MTDHQPAQPERALVPVEIVYRVVTQVDGVEMALVRYPGGPSFVVRADELQPVRRPA